jgi:hypothetical protein
MGYSKYDDSDDDSDDDNTNNIINGSGYTSIKKEKNNEIKLQKTKLNNVSVIKDNKDTENKLKRFINFSFV